MLFLSVSILYTLSYAGLIRFWVAFWWPGLSFVLLFLWQPSFCRILSFGVFLVSCAWMTRGVSVRTVSILVFRTATSMSWAGDDCGWTRTMAVGVLRREVILSLASSRFVKTWLPLFPSFLCCLWGHSFQAWLPLFHVAWSCHHIRHCPVHRAAHPLCIFLPSLPSRLFLCPGGG